MSAAAAIPLFLVSLAVTLGAARLFARRLDRLGVRFGFPEALIGLLTALAADGPNISSALYAVVRGEHSVGIGLLVGSNAFQLAAMIGMSALLAGTVMLPRDALVVEGVAGLLVTVLAAAALLGWLMPAVALALGACVGVAYLTIVIGGSELLVRRRHEHRPGGRLERLLDQRRRPERSDPPPSDPTHHLLALVVVDVAVIIAGSVGMVEAALALGGQWGISRAVLGVVILAPITSLPNAITGVRLGLAGRGAALVGETFNSNTLNLGVGVLVPALFTPLGVLTATGKLQLTWLIAMTVACIALLAMRRGMSRGGGAFLVLLYLGFVALQALSP
ncbi:MAG: sodium:calcium antiporter [Solirubrobacteraceae bacterium]